MNYCRKPIFTMFSCAVVRLLLNVTSFFCSIAPYFPCCLPHGNNKNFLWIISQRLTGSWETKPWHNHFVISGSKSVIWHTAIFAYWACVWWSSMLGDYKQYILSAAKTVNHPSIFNHLSLSSLSKAARMSFLSLAKSSSSSSAVLRCFLAKEDHVFPPRCFGSNALFRLSATQIFTMIRSHTKSMITCDKTGILRLIGSGDANVFMRLKQ